MKKQNKKTMKNTRTARNVYGQKCIAKEVILNKETALDQYMEVLKDIERHKMMNINIEYDVKMPKDVFSEEEIAELNRKISKLTMLRSGMLNLPFNQMSVPGFPTDLKAI